MITRCEDCEHSHSENEKRPAYRWMCVKFPRVERENFVTTDERLTDPYMHCQNINGGKCCVFSPRKGPQIRMNLNDKE